MVSRIPLVDSWFSCSDVLKAYRAAEDVHLLDAFAEECASRLHAPEVALSGSGNCAFLTILEVLKRYSSRDEVIIPAYTAGSLMVAVRQAGLKPVICDIEPSTCGLRNPEVLRLVGDHTLAVLVVHLFGIPDSAARQLKSSLPGGCVLIEDCCQAMGSMQHGAPLGSNEAIRFYSFNRGKNFPLYSGGAIASSDTRFMQDVRERLRTYPHGNPRVLAVQMCAFSQAVRPRMYGVFYPAIACAKDTHPPQRIARVRMSPLHAALGLRGLPTLEPGFLRRWDTIRYFQGALQNVRHITLPDFSHAERVVSNRLPVLCVDSAARSALRQKLWQAGIDSSPMYQQPLHHMFALGFAPEAFPHACDFARRVLTIPVHPQVDDVMRQRIVDVMRSR